MNTRDRFLATMQFESTDRPVLWEFGYWAPTIRRWYHEGLPRTEGIDDNLGDDAVVSGECLGVDWRNPHFAWDVNRHLEFDEPNYRIPVNNLYAPAFETKVLEDHPDWVKIIDGNGETVEISKSNGSRRHLDSPVKTRKDYETIREERLQPNLEGRLPENWNEIKKTFQDRTFPLEYGGMQGFFNTPRRLLGFERLMYAFCTDPQLVKDIINDTADLLIALYDPLLSELGGDLAMISEDMCFKSGCFISPDMFREFMMPAYKRLIGFYRDHGLKTIWVDSDGDVMQLIPLLVECGATGLHPFEMTGTNDLLEVRRQFPKFQILGGIDKKKIALGKKAIDEEIDHKVAPLYQHRGFIPFVDHTVPPEVSWDDFCYYRQRLSELSVSK